LIVSQSFVYWALRSLSSLVQNDKSDNCHLSRGNKKERTSNIHYMRGYWNEWMLDYWFLLDLQHICVLGMSISGLIWELYSSVCCKCSYCSLYSLFFLCLIHFAQDFCSFYVFFVFNLFFFFCFGFVLVVFWVKPGFLVWFIVDPKISGKSSLVNPVGSMVEALFGLSLF